MRIAICEHSPLFRDSLAELLTAHGHEVVGCVGADPGPVSLVRSTRPDALLQDAGLVLDGTLEELRRVIRTSGQRTRVVLLTGGLDDPAGPLLPARLVDDVVPRTSDLVTLERAITGMPAIRPRQVLPAQRPTPPGPVEALTPREREVVDLLVAGYSTQRISTELGIRSSTVHTHVQGVLRKLGAGSRLQAVSTYVAQGASTHGLTSGSIKWGVRSHR